MHSYAGKGVLVGLEEVNTRLWEALLICLLPKTVD